MFLDGRDAVNHITTSDGWTFFYAYGEFDPWCVYVQHIPLDKEYFKQLKILSDKYGRDKVYNDFLKVYNIVDENFDNKLGLSIAQEIDSTYEENTIPLWIILYMTMIAEERKENAILKKRIKHLGVYNVLIDECDIDDVVTYMKNVDWKILDKYMKERGI